jgi:hypothetical protein
MPALLAAALCHHAVTLPEAKALALATPVVADAVAQGGVHPYFDDVERGASGWSFTVKAHRRCAVTCSTLIGHVAVDRRGRVVELDRGDNGVVVTSPRIAALRARETRRCP